jgi:hypothetical protein
MGISQYFIIQSNRLFDLSHDRWGGIVVNGNEATLFVVSISLLVWKFRAKAMRQVANSVILNRANDTSTLNNLVRDTLDEVGQGMESCTG